MKVETANNRVVIDVPFGIFEDAIITALERDTGKAPIIGEILRIMKIRTRKANIYLQKCANLQGSKYGK